MTASAASPVAVRLGNPAPQIQVPILDDADAPTGQTRLVPAPHMERSVTTVTMRPGFADAKAVELTLSTSNDKYLTMIARLLPDKHARFAVGVLEVDQAMQIHSAGAAPTWVDCPEMPEFAQALGDHFACHVGEPTNLLTSAGRDALHAQHMSTAAQPAAFNYMAISANSTAASSASTTLPGEITTAGGGLVRAQATYAHTAGTNTSTLTKTFTANGSDSLPVTIAKMGVLNASSAGTLAYETLLNASAVLSLAGDNLAITETLTAG